MFTIISDKLNPVTTELFVCRVSSPTEQNKKPPVHVDESQFTQIRREYSCSWSQRSQIQIYMVREPDGLGGGFGPVLVRPAGSRKVPEVVSQLKRDHDICVVVSLRDDFDEEAKFVGFSKGDDAGAERAAR